VRDLSLDCLRTVNTDDWWLAIKKLMDMAILVVFNADTESSGTVREAKQALKQNYTYKTLFLTGDRALLAQRLREDPQLAAKVPDCFIARTPILVAVIAEMLDRRTPPSRENSVWLFAQAASLAACRTEADGRGGL
jgi:hypothetical protein